MYHLIWFLLNQKAFHSKTCFFLTFHIDPYKCVNEGHSAKPLHTPHKWLHQLIQLSPLHPVMKGLVSEHLFASLLVHVSFPWLYTKNWSFWAHEQVCLHVIKSCILLSIFLSSKKEKWEEKGIKGEEREGKGDNEEGNGEGRKWRGRKRKGGKGMGGEGREQKSKGEPNRTRVDGWEAMTCLL